MVVGFFFVEWMGVIVKSMITCVIVIVARYCALVIMIMLVVV
jgi:hypothetical protein